MDCRRLRGPWDGPRDASVWRVASSCRCGSNAAVEIAELVGAHSAGLPATLTALANRALARARHRRAGRRIDKPRTRDAPGLIACCPTLHAHTLNNGAGTSREPRLARQLRTPDSGRPRTSRPRTARIRIETRLESWRRSHSARAVGPRTDARSVCRSPWPQPRQTPRFAGGVGSWNNPARSRQACPPPAVLPTGVGASLRQRRVGSFRSSAGH